MNELTALRRVARKRRGTVTNLQIRNTRMRDLLEVLAAAEEAGS